jgi:ribosomal protein S18 acetylase RimI-like enzyme
MDPNQISPRPATTADATRLNALARAAYAVYLPIIGREPMPMAADWATLLGEQEIWILDEPGGGPTDFLLGSLALQVRADHVVIWSIAVAPERQRAGIGRALMRFAEQRARALGLGELRLFTNARMTRNIELYRGLGYAETGREDLADRSIVHMSKRIGHI